MKTCFKCGNKSIDDDAPECPNCGASFLATRKCRRCGREFEHILGTSSAGYCPQCFAYGQAKGYLGPKADAPDGSNVAQRFRWGTILVVLGVGSLLLPLCGFQFRVMTLLQMPLGEYWWVVGALAILIGIALFALGYCSYLRTR